MRRIIGACAVLLAGGLLSETVPAEPAGAATELTVPASVDASGRTDVTEVLNGFFVGLPPGAVVSFPGGGRYRIEGTVTLVNRRDVTIDGNGATFVATTDGAGTLPGRGQRAHWPRLRQHWRILRGSGITVRDLTIEGANPKGGATSDAYVPALEGQAGIAVQRATDVVVEDVAVRTTYGDGVWITGGSTEVTVRDSTFERIGRQGIAVVNGQRVVVERNDLSGISRSVFDLEPVGRALAQDVRLRDNQVGDYGNFLLAAGGGGAGVSDVWLERNRVDGGHGVSVFAGVANRRRSGLHIVGNTGTGARRPPAGTGREGLLQLQNLDGVEIRDNRQRVAGGPAISVDRVCDLTVTGNDFDGAEPEQEVVAPCGAAAPAPSPAAPTTRPPAGPAPTAAPAPVGPDDGGGGTDPFDLLLAGLVGFGVGIGVAIAVFAAWRRQQEGGPG